jgi:hypothetical protein
MMDESAFEQPCEPMVTHLVVFRDNDTIWRLEMEALEFALFERLIDGQIVEAALAAVLSDQPDDGQASRVSLWFARWMNHRLLSEIISD